MKKFLSGMAGVALLLLLGQCSVSKSVREAKALGNCKFRLASADSMYLAGISLKEFKDISNFKDLDLAKYPALGLGLLKKSVPLDLRITMEATNPTREVAGVEQMEYKVLLGKSEIFSGFHNQRIEILPGTGRTLIPIQLSTNAYDLVMNNETRNDVINLLQALTSTNENKSARMQIKIKPTLAFGSKQVNYPGYITFEKDITAEMLLNR